MALLKELSAFPSSSRLLGPSFSYSASWLSSFPPGTPARWLLQFPSCQFCLCSEHLYTGNRKRRAKDDSHAKKNATPSSKVGLRGSDLLRSKEGTEVARALEHPIIPSAETLHPGITRERPNGPPLATGCRRKRLWAEALCESALHMYGYGLNQDLAVRSD
jgi:hypothetical protein